MKPGAGALKPPQAPKPPPPSGSAAPAAGPKPGIGGAAGAGKPPAQAAWRGLECPEEQHRPVAKLQVLLVGGIVHPSAAAAGLERKRAVVAEPLRRRQAERRRAILQPPAGGPTHIAATRMLPIGPAKPPPGTAPATPAPGRGFGGGGGFALPFAFPFALPTRTGRGAGRGFGGMAHHTHSSKFEGAFARPGDGVEARAPRLLGETPMSAKSLTSSAAW